MLSDLSIVVNTVHQFQTAKESQSKRNQLSAEGRRHSTSININTATVTVTTAATVLPLLLPLPLPTMPIVGPITVEITGTDKAIIKTTTAIVIVIPPLKATHHAPIITKLPTITTIPIVVVVAHRVGIKLLMRVRIPPCCNCSRFQRVATSLLQHTMWCDLSFLHTYIHTYIPYDMIQHILFLFRSMRDIRTIVHI